MLNKKRPIRVVVLGLGLSGEFIHFPLIQANPNFQILGIFKRHFQNFELNHSKFNGIKFYSSIDGIIADSNLFDLAVIATPNRTHKVYASQLLEKGLDIVIEKPVTGSKADTNELFNKAISLSRKIFVFQNRRWDSDYLSLKKILEMDLIGDIYSLESNWENMKEAKNTWRNSKDPEELGGIVLDMGSHLIDQEIQLLGEVKEMSASIEIIRPNAVTEDEMRIELLHNSGVKSIIFASHFRDRENPRFRVKGTNGEIIIKEYDSQENELRAKSYFYDKISLITIEKPKILIKQRTRNGQSDIYLDYVRGRWADFYSHVAENLLHEKNFPIKLDEILINSEILDYVKNNSISKTIPRVNSVP